jgi:hypothetical protein
MNWHGLTTSIREDSFCLPFSSSILFIYSIYIYIYIYIYICIFFIWVEFTIIAAG